MGFFDEAFKIVKYVGNDITEKVNKISAKRAEYECSSDDQLFRIVHSGNGLFSNSGTEKAIACKLLVERGYSQEKIKSWNS